MSKLPPQIDIERYRGDTNAYEIQVVSEETGLAVDITGYSFLLTVDTLKAPTDNTTKVFTISGAITSAIAGRVEFVPSSSQSDSTAKLFYDVQMTDSVGRITTIQKGRWTFKQDITK